MSRLKKGTKSIVSSLLGRRKADRPDEEAHVASTLEEIAREVKQEALLSKDEFFAPTHVLKPETPPVARKEKTVRGRRLTADQYERAIESSLTVLEQADEIIDRNRAATAKLKKTSV